MFIIYVKDKHGSAYPSPTNKHDRTLSTILISDKLRMDKANIRRRYIFVFWIPILCTFLSTIATNPITNIIASTLLM